MSTPLTPEKITQLNHLLTASLEEASKEDLMICVRLLGTIIANLKIQHKISSDASIESFLQTIHNLEHKNIAEDAQNLTAQMIIECASALAVVRNDHD